MRDQKTITYRGAVLDIEFNFYPEEAQMRYYKDGDGHPGSPAEVEIDAITIGGVCVIDLLDDMIRDIEETLMESL